jgi:hypothetical protein
MIAKEPNVRRYEFQKDRDEARCLFLYRPENIGVSFKSIAMMQSGTAQSRGKGRKLRTWLAHERQLDREIEQVERELLIAQRDFKERFGIEPEEAPAEIERIREEIQENEHANNILSAKIAEDEELIEAMIFEYKTQMLLIDLRPDKEEIYRLLEEGREVTRNAYDKQLFDQTYRRLSTITDEDFKKIIETLSMEQAQALIEIRKTKEKHDL